MAENSRSCPVVVAVDIITVINCLFSFYMHEFTANEIADAEEEIYLYIKSVKYVFFCFDKFPRGSFWQRSSPLLSNC